MHRLLLFRLPLEQAALRRVRTCLQTIHLVSKKGCRKGSAQAYRELKSVSYYSAANQLPASAAAPPSVQVEDDDDAAIPPLDASFQNPPPPPHTPAPAAGAALLLALDGFPMLGDQLSPPVTAPLTGNLASEIAHLQQSTNPYTSEDLQDMPDMESPVVSFHAPLAVQNDSVSIA